MDIVIILGAGEDRREEDDQRKHKPTDVRSHSRFATVVENSNPDDLSFLPGLRVEH